MGSGLRQSTRLSFCIPGLVLPLARNERKPGCGRCGTVYNYQLKTPTRSVWWSRITPHYVLYAKKIDGKMKGAATESERQLMAVFYVNATVRSEGLYHTLVVFGAIHLPARSITSSTQIPPVKSIDTPMIEVES